MCQGFLASRTVINDRGLADVLSSLGPRLVDQMSCYEGRGSIWWFVGQLKGYALWVMRDPVVAVSQPVRFAFVVL